jgi:hypothetical protein
VNNWLLASFNFVVLLLPIHLLNRVHWMWPASHCCLYRSLPCSVRRFSS